MISWLSWRKDHGGGPHNCRSGSEILQRENNHIPCVSTHSLSVGLILMNGVFFSVAHSAKFHGSSSSIDVHTPLSSLDPFNLINMGLCAEVYGDNPGGFKYPAITTPTVKGEGC